MIISNLSLFRYDRERDSFSFVTQVKDEKEVSFTYTSDFDEQGILYWLGTNGRTCAEWTNPAAIGVVKVRYLMCSDVSMSEVYELELGVSELRML